MDEFNLDLSHTTEPICPHCGSVYRDAWELDFDEGSEAEMKVECGSCEKEYRVARQVSVTYSTKRD